MSHPDEARRYEELKIGLAERPRDSDPYAKCEDVLRSKVLRLARASTGASPDAPAG